MPGISCTVYLHLPVCILPAFLVFHPRSGSLKPIASLVPFRCPVVVLTHPVHTLGLVVYEVVERIAVGIIGVYCEQGALMPDVPCTVYLRSVYAIGQRSLDR